MRQSSRKTVSQKPVRRHAARAAAPASEFEPRAPVCIGYARVSTADQDPALQFDALHAAGCSPIFDDTASGALEHRPGLDRALAELRAGDTLIVWRLDRLGRSLAHLLALVKALEGRGVAFRSLVDGIDTSTAAGRFVFHIFGALSEFERNLISERTNAGLAAARKRGAMIGRRRALTPMQLEHARVLLERGETATLVARSLGCDRSTLYRALSREVSVSKPPPY